MPERADPHSLESQLLQGDRLALSRACSLVENGTPAGETLLSRLFPRSGQAHLVGVTGAPGSGKSTLVNGIVRLYRAQFPDRRVAVIAVDPTSPFSGGAVLGDRVRMRDLSGDDQVFIRSMATRGALGGLAGRTTDLALLFDAAGYALVIIETVGAGQNEVDVVHLAHTTVVVEAPGMGDEVQAIKAGILEIADILVLNKADQPGADAAERALRMLLELARESRAEGTGRSGEKAGEAWFPPLLRTVALQGQGLPELVSAVLGHRAALERSGGFQEKEHERLRGDVVGRLKEELYGRFAAGAGAQALEGALASVYARRLSPGEAVRRLLDGGP